ncbi:MAG: ComEC/Rec2 family competence protein [Methylacidiphilales bacterium]|nr:ComEC/Rec2 family competence protein [Candidatus Methylacidiphilales bacterium]
MLSPRAPLFSVSLAFATGCLLGLDGLFTLTGALVLFWFAGLIWFVLGRHEKASLAAFYVLTACAGLAHTLLLGASIPADDLRRLPDEKTLDTTQWRGLIVEEPAAQFTTHASRRALDRTSFVLRMEAWRPTGGRLFGADIDAPWQPAQGHVRCTVVGPAKELQCGDRLEFATALDPVASPLSPGDLDYRAYEAEQGIFYHATIPEANWLRVETGGGDWWQNLSFRARDWAYERLQIGLEDDPRMADFLAGMLIGYRQEIPTDIEQDFRRTGTLHVFAVSGQNIAEMVVVALILLQLCGLVRWRWAFLIAPVVLLYCLLTGSPASAVRATVMALAILLAWRLGRPLNALGCWSLALLAMLIWNPSVLLDPGAQLSFAIVLGLILIAPPITRFLVRPFLPDPFLPSSLLTTAQRIEKRFWWVVVGLFGTGIAAVLVTEPITAIDFHQVTPISILANLVVVPMAGLITMIGTLSVAVSLVSTFLAALLNNANWLLARALIFFVGFLAHKPGASINVPDLRALSSPTPSFVVAPLRDSACLLVRTGGPNWLVNTGRESPTPSTTWHLLQFYGINRLDGLVLAQMSAPDNSGAEAIIRDFHPQHLVVPLLRTRSALEKTVPEMVALAGRPGESWQRGGSFQLGPDLGVDVLHPAADSTESHADDRALVLLFHAGSQTLLWAGRVGVATQQDLLAAYPGLRADVLVMGTEPPPGEDWLRSLQVRDWLQIPSRDRLLNSTDAAPVPDFCQVWSLEETGAVDIHFQSAQDNHPPEILLRPWVALPSEQ